MKSVKAILAKPADPRSAVLWPDSTEDQYCMDVKWAKQAIYSRPIRYVASRQDHYPAISVLLRPPSILEKTSRMPMYHLA